MRYPVTELGHTLSHRVLLPSSLELNQCVGKCDLIHGIDGDIPMTNQARMRLLRYVNKTKKGGPYSGSLLGVLII